jgi:NAD(P)-dependent dehydrogenase (short-subunit alcohol dehydrogenase family)
MSHSPEDPAAPIVALAGRHALVVGAGKPIGLAIARALGAAGSDVGLAVLEADESVLRARGVQRELREAGRAASTYVMDVTLGQNVKVTTRQVTKELGGLDLVVSAPDEPFFAPLASTSEAQLGQTITRNALAHFYVARAAFDEFRRGGRGCLLLIAHALGEHGASGAAAYTMANAATLGLARALHAERPSEDVAVAVLLRGAGLPGGSGASLGTAILDEDERQVELLARLATAVAAEPPAVVSGRVFRIGDEPMIHAADSTG